MNEARFFTTDGQEIARLDDVTLVPECLEKEICERIDMKLQEGWEATIRADTRGWDLLQFKLTMGVIPDVRGIPRMRIRKPGWRWR